MYTNFGHKFLQMLYQQDLHHRLRKIKEIGSWVKEVITFCPFSPISACAKKLPKFAVMHVDLS